MIRILLVAGLLALPAHAGKLVLLTDQPSGDFATEVKTLFTITPPFSRMKDLDIEIVKMDHVPCDFQTGATAVTNYSSRPDSCKAKGATDSLSRAAECKSDAELTKIQTENNAERMLYLRNSDDFGGASGSVPVVLTNAGALSALHELTHTFGFADEYEYPTACEADLFCGMADADIKLYRDTGLHYGVPQLSVNVAVFADAPPYSSDADARQRHGKDIPWFGKIAASTKITTGSQLGTPSGPPVIGLYRASVCNRTTGPGSTWKAGRQPKPKKTWKPGSQTTYMEALVTNYIDAANWDVIAQGLNSTISEANPNEYVYKFRLSFDSMGKPSWVTDRVDAAPSVAPAEASH